LNRRIAVEFYNQQRLLYLSQFIMARHVAPAVVGAVAATVLAPHHPPHAHPPHGPPHGPHPRPHPHRGPHAPKPAVHAHVDDVEPKDLDPKGRLTMEGQLRAARWSLERSIHPHNLLDELVIPQWVLRKAKGIVFLSVIKAGFVFAPMIGTGCIITRRPNGGWTGPSSVGAGGLSFGFQAGATKVDYIMILTDDKQVRQFSGKGQLRLGGEIQLAVGPVGRNGHGSVGANTKGVSLIFTYSHAQGLFGGLALDGKILSVRNGCNEAFYGKKVECGDILTGNIGDIPRNRDYDAIVRLLNRHSQLDEIYDEVKEDIPDQAPVVEDIDIKDVQKEEEESEEKQNVIESNIRSTDDGKPVEEQHTLTGESDDDCVPDEEEITDEGVKDDKDHEGSPSEAK